MTTPEIIVRRYAKMVTNRFDDPVTIEFARHGFIAMFEEIARRRAPAAQPKQAPLRGADRSFRKTLFTM